MLRNFLFNLRCLDLLIFVLSEFCQSIRTKRLVHEKLPKQLKMSIFRYFYTSIRHNLNIQVLKIQSNKLSDFRFISSRNFVETIRYGPLKYREVFVVFRVQTLLFDKPPKSFNQIQIGRIRWQKQQFNTKHCSTFLHLCTVLITGIIEQLLAWKTFVELSLIAIHRLYLH